HAHAPPRIHTLSLHDALPISRLVTVDGEEVQLANKEFELLRVLMSRAGQVVSREEILAEVWNDLDTAALKTSKTLDMHMSWLRRDRKSTRLNSSHVKTSYAVF